MNPPANLKWKIVGPELGKGGQGAVFPVKENGSEKTYAMKVIDSHRPKQALGRFHREIEAIKRLNHPSIVKLVDASNPDDGFQYYVMDYIENARSLKQRMELGTNYCRNSTFWSLPLFTSLLEVIRECNNKGVIHRDLSPNNVLFDDKFNAYVIDFGLCQITDGVAVTLTDEGLGTRNYAAPEVESGSENDVTWKSDLYSAAKVLWTAITNQSAFARESPVFKNKSLKTLLPTNPSAWHLREIFARSIRHDPNDRFGSIDEALTFTRRVSGVVNAGFLPLESLVAGQCPICGLGDLMDAPQGHVVFGNPNPDGVGSYMCKRCGMYFARSYAVAANSIDRGQALQ